MKPHGFAPQKQAASAGRVTAGHGQLGVYLGIDLSGPSNIKDTVAAAFEPAGNGLKCIRITEGADDHKILSLAEALSLRGPLAVGLDAPLSYNPGGGDRPSDRALRKKLVSAGLKSGTIMPPTMNRMVYLTLRGMAVARMLSQTIENIFIAEIHPAGAMALRGADPGDVRQLKQDRGARARLLAWMAGLGMAGMETAGAPSGPLASDSCSSDSFPPDPFFSDHCVAACAAALGIWQLRAGRPAWHAPPAPPFHPYDYAC